MSYAEEVVHFFGLFFNEVYEALGVACEI